MSRDTYRQKYLVLDLEKTDNIRVLLYRENITLQYGMSGETYPLENHSCSVVLPHCSI